MIRNPTFYKFINKKSEFIQNIKMLRKKEILFSSDSSNYILSINVKRKAQASRRLKFALIVTLKKLNSY